MKRPLENLVERFESILTQMLDLKREIVEYKALYEKSVKIFFELVNLNDPRIDNILAREEIVVTGPNGERIFPRPQPTGPQVLFDGTKN